MSSRLKSYTVAILSVLFKSFVNAFDGALKEEVEREAGLPYFEHLVE